MKDKVVENSIEKMKIFYIEYVRYVDISFKFEDQNTNVILSTIF